MDEDIADVEAAQSGDGEAFGRVIRRHQGEIAGRMWRFTRDPAAHADLVQDVFVNAYQSLDSYRRLGPFSHWLHKIAVRTGYACWRRRAKEPVALDESALRRLSEPPAGEDSKEAGELVHRALSCLPPRDRLVLTLMYLEGCSVTEVAELSGWSIVMVKVQAWRARGKLKKALRNAEEAQR
ncbi:MAG: sigma-70 family RNA polymerase sigma factor [Elusimicrobia bacterium]|nr:sigma-70 family RNA polymerase sigma factor [Elusimicrobiota bacterium]